MAITCTIDATGIVAPTYDEVLSYFQNQFRLIFGSDIDIDPDTQDGQWIAIMAKAVSDANAMAVAVYNAFSPSTAQGAGLSRNVKINGITRKVASRSTVDVTLTGVASTVVPNGYVTDEAGNAWDLPTSVTIGRTGEVTVTATARELGAIHAPAGSITEIATPTKGWQSVTNAFSATPGDPVEADAALRRRQAASTAIPSQSVLEGLMGAVAAIPGVTRVTGVDNDTSSTDADGVPGHAFSLVVSGGNSATIAETIAKKKGQIRAFGSTIEEITDDYGIAHSIGFMRATEVPIAAVVTVKALSGYSTNIGAKISAAVADYIDGLGQASMIRTVYLSRLYVPASLSGADANTFDIASIEISRDGEPVSVANVTLAYDEVPTCVSDGVLIVVE